MPVIESYSFGRMTIDGATYTGDIIIYPDGSMLNPWWRKSGHRLEVSDIRTLIDTEPEIIVVGTGASGQMKPAAEVSETLRTVNIELIVRPTSEAVRIYNDRSPTQAVGGCFHLTC